MPDEDSSTERPIRVLLVDDHTIVRSGLRMLVEIDDDICVVGESGSGREALEWLDDVLGQDGEQDERRPDVVLMDLFMEDIGGVEATREIKSRWPDLRVLVLTMESDATYLREAFRAGASGYVLKDAVNEDLVEAIRTVAEGGRYLHMALAAKLMRAEATARGSADGKQGVPLSRRETEILQLVALGHSNREIAEQLFISVRTVETHRTNIKQKTGANTRADLVRFAKESGLSA